MPNGNLSKDMHPVFAGYAKDVVNQDTPSIFPVQFLILELGVIDVLKLSRIPGFSEIRYFYYSLYLP